MNSYQKAVEALKQCVTDSMAEDVSSSTQGEIWRHYQGMKTIADSLTTEETTTPSSSIGMSPLGREFYDPDYNVYAAAAADTISFDSVGQDVITFS